MTAMAQQSCRKVPRNETAIPLAEPRIAFETERLFLCCSHWQQWRASRSYC